MTRRIPREEGIFAGNSAGSALAGLLQMKNRFKESDVVVVIFHDHGTRYLGKMFNEDWMRDRGFIEPSPKKLAMDLISPHANLPLLFATSDQRCSDVFSLMQKYKISQLPVKDEHGNFVGSVEDNILYASLLKGDVNLSDSIVKIMRSSYPIVSHSDTIEFVSSLINDKNPAVLMMDMGGNWHIITKQDVIQGFIN
jgi:cystathionine beta-synthase